MSSRVWLTLVAITIGGAALLHWPAADDQMLEPGWAATVGVVDTPTLADPFGLAVAPDGTLFVSDGAGGNRIYAITPDGRFVEVAGSEEGFADGHGRAARFHAPSSLAIDRHGTVYVADTGNNAVRRVTRDGQVATVATGLNGPIGIAVDPRDRVLVADTYADRIVAVGPGGTVTPLSIDVELDTPSGIAVDATGVIYVADTGNHVVRMITPAGQTRTLDAADAGGLRHPIGLAVAADGVLYVTDSSGRVIEIRADTFAGKARVIAGSSRGFRNGPGHEAQFRQLAGVAAPVPGRLVVADAGNALVRRVTAVGLADAVPPPSPRIQPRFDIDAFTVRPLLWPLDPLHGPFEVAGTLGEARGQDAGRFHSGIDVRAEQGAAVLAVREGIVSTPLATGDFDSLNEWMRIDELTYVHLRVGRTRRGEIVDSARFVATRDEQGDVTRVRVKRGAHFRTGDVVGSVNRFNHVHLNVGWDGEEYNPLLFRLVQFEDRVPPTIARGGIRLLDAQGTPLATRVKGRLLVSGPVQVIVDAWDQADGNRPGRRLGVYSLGYQVLHPDGTPAPGFAAPIDTIRFDRLIADPGAASLVYASGSGIPFYGQRRTRFLYIVTNTFRDGIATPGVWDTTQLPPGEYTLRVKVADIHGNEALQNRDVAVTVTGREHTAGG